MLVHETQDFGDKTIGITATCGECRCGARTGGGGIETERELSADDARELREAPPA